VSDDEEPKPLREELIAEMRLELSKTAAKTWERLGLTRGEISIAIIEWSSRFLIRELAILDARPIPKRKAIGD
jgi:hypothetical protein